MSRYIVIGSGISALGAIEALIENGIKPTVIDIGIIPEKKIINKLTCGKKWNGSYSGYGIFDKKSPLSIKTKRLCSSHQFGGFGSVWTGSFHLPYFEDLDISHNEFKKIIRYAKEFKRKYTLNSDYALIEEDFTKNSQSNISNVKFKKARIAILKSNSQNKIEFKTNSASISNLGPIFNPSVIINNYSKNKLLNYIGNSYAISIDEKRNNLIYIKDDKINEINFSKLFVCCGCINSIYLLQGMKKENKYSLFKLNVAPSISIPFISLRKRKTTKLHNQANYHVPTDFLIIKSIKGVKNSVFCQISQLNLELFKYANIPSFLQKFLLRLSPHIFIAQIRLSSKNAFPTYLKVKGYRGIDNLGEVIIKEPKNKFHKKSLKNSFEKICSILSSKGFYTNKIFINLFKFIVGQDSCGWHMGIDLDFNKNIKISKKTFSKNNIHFCDSITLKHIPATTIFSILYGRSKMLVLELLKSKP